MPKLVAQSTTQPSLTSNGKCTTVRCALKCALLRKILFEINFPPKKTKTNGKMRRNKRHETMEVVVATAHTRTQQKNNKMIYRSVFSVAFVSPEIHKTTKEREGGRGGWAEGKRCAGECTNNFRITFNVFGRFVCIASLVALHLSIIIMNDELLSIRICDLSFSTNEAAAAAAAAVDVVLRKRLTFG